MSTAALSTETGYSTFARFIHWTMVVLMLAVFYTGFAGYWGASEQPWTQVSALLSPAAEAPPRAPMGPPPGLAAAQRRGQNPWSPNQLHKSFGLLVLLLVALRLVYRAMSDYPGSRAEWPFYMSFGSRLVHWLLYAGLVLQPLTGLTGSGKGFLFFGTVKIPSVAIPAYIQVLHLVHIDIAWSLLLLIFIHSCAALFHHYFLKDDVLRGMLVGRR